MHKISQTRKYMNTEITLSVIKTEQDSTVDIQNAIEAGFGEFDRIVETYTRFSPTSELSELNRNSGSWQAVSAEFYHLISTMLDLSELTEGAFDPTVIDFLETYGYDPNYDFSKLDNPDLNSLVNKMANDRSSWREIELDPQNLKVKLATGQRIDLGGIGKGYAIDKAYEKLDRFEHFIINAGGDVRAKGQNEQSKDWKLGLLHKEPTGEPIQIGTVSTSGLAVASSGSWARKVKQFHHIINPSDGKPVDSMQTVFVAAPTAAEADGWATALFVGGTKLLQKLPNLHHAMAIDNSSKVAKTHGFELV